MSGSRTETSPSVRGRAREKPAPGRPPDGQEGFALVLAILVLVAVTVIAAAGIVMADSDLKVSVAHRSSVDARHVAAAGLADYLSVHDSPVAADTFVYGQDSAVVSAEQMVSLGDDEGRRMYRLTADGATRMSRSRGLRSIHGLGLFQTGRVHSPGAITSGSGLDVNGNSATVSGNDACAGSDSTLAGVSVPQGGNCDGCGDVADGDPPVDSTAVSGEALLQTTEIDWSGIVGGNVVSPDYTIPGDSWPDFSSIPSDEYPVIYLDTATYDLGPSNGGRGTIIAEGALNMNGSFSWDGLILVGEQLVTDGKQDVRGTVVAALNILLGQSVPTGSLGNGTKSYQFDSCHAEEASQQAFRRIMWEPGTWAESM